MSRPFGHCCDAHPTCLLLPPCKKGGDHARIVAKLAPINKGWSTPSADMLGRGDPPESGLGVGRDKTERIQGRMREIGAGWRQKRGASTRGRGKGGGRYRYRD